MSTSSIDTPSADKLDPNDLPDIQGFIVHGYNMPFVRHFVLTIGNVDEALTFLKTISSGSGPLTVTSAKPWPGGQKPPYALNIGLTARGLEALDLPSDVSFGKVSDDNFSSFLKGATAANIAKKVFDVGPNAPRNWVTKVNTDNANSAHVLLSLYANTADAREEHSETLRNLFGPVIPSPGEPDSDVFEQDVDAIVVTDSTGRKRNKIHFGYTDGISNPIIDVVGASELRPDQLPYVEAWRFVMREGAPEYKPPRPRGLGLNGSFSAFRILEQDVAAFEAFLSADGRTKDEQEFLASKLCGRWRNGNPVVVRPEVPGDVLPNDQLRDFDYGDDDVGEPCPYSAHTRRANARGGPGVRGVTNKVSFRIIRRANPYGPPYTGADDGERRGLAGHFICASLFNQFEFIMNTWANEPNFAARPAGIDPLLGKFPSDPPTKSDFTYYLGRNPKTKKPNPITVQGLSQFVTTRGGMYCFLPSITALKWLADNGGNSNPWKIPT